MASDTKIKCRAFGCYWNIGIQFVEEGDNCACKDVEIAHTQICRSYIERREAERRLRYKSATSKGGKVDE